LEPREARELARVDTLRLATRGQDALVLIERLLPGARPGSGYLLALRLREGELRTSLGQTRAGEEILRPALDLAWSLGDSAHACAVIRWLAVAVGGQGRVGESATLCRRLRDLARARGDLRHEGWALVGLAWAAEQEARLPGAAGLYRDAARAFAAANDPRSESWAQNGLGTVLASMGSYVDARTAYAEAAALAGATGYRMVEAMAADNFGSLEYGLGDPGVAAAWFTRAAEIHRSLGEIRIALFPLMNLALCEAQLGRYETAADTLEALLARCRTEGYRGGEEASVLLKLAEVRELQGRRREADRLRREVLVSDAGALPRHRNEAVIGVALSMAGRDSAATAIELLEDTRSRLPEPFDPGLRIQLETALGRLRLASGAPGPALVHLRAASRLAAETGLDGSAIEALAWAGRAWRAVGDEDSARSALDRAARAWEAERRVPVDPEWRERRGLTGRQVCTELASLVERSDGARAAWETAQRFKSRTLLERMDPSGAAAEDGAPPLGASVPLSLLQQTLRDGEVFLDYYLGPERSLLFAITRDSCRVVELAPEARLEPRIRLYHGLVSRPPTPRDGAVAATRDDPLEGAGESLRRELLGPVEDLVAAGRIVIACPDGAANLVSFAALPEGGRAGVAWGRVPSAPILVSVRSRSGTPRELPGSVRALAPRSGPLAWARREVRQLRDDYQGVDLRLVADAETVTAQDLVGARLLHVAGHVETDDQRPWRSSVCLGARGIAAEEIVRARTRIDLAFLSGCRSTQSRVLSGEGALGLSAAFLGAGASCVIGTLWAVDDRVTTRLVRRFYHELAGGSDVATALRRAQEALRGEAATAHPFYWAAFMPIGAGDVRVPLESRRPAAPLLLAAAGGFALVVILRGCRVILRRRSRLT
jgi:tetratricopeptide (TPR) repeat protein